MTRLLSLLLLAALLSAAPAVADPPAAGLTLIPPDRVTDQVTLEIRAAVRNPSGQARAFDAAIYLDREAPAFLLGRRVLKAGAGAAAGLSLRWPTRGQAGRHRILLVARAGGRVLRAGQEIEIAPSRVRSPGRVEGAWVSFNLPDMNEGRHYDPDLARMSEAQWRELVRGMHALHMDVIVIQTSFVNHMHYGSHHIERDGYQGRAFYPSRLYPGRMPLAAKDPIEAVLQEADRQGMHVFMGAGTYAWFDYSPASLAWHVKLADELWERYGHHPSFYGWYVSDEIAGDLGGTPERWRAIAAFFEAFQAHCRALAPDKPVMLAPNCYHVPRAIPAWRKLLPHVDILCPFAFQRMPADDIGPERAADLLQELCDEAGTHLWLDMEVFLFDSGGALIPRPLFGLVDDLRRHPTFEKILCFQYPGLFCSPSASIQAGGPAAVRAFEEYARFLREGGMPGARRRGTGRPVKLATAYSPRYTGGGDGALADGRRGSAYYLDPAWQGYWGEDLDAVVDLGKRTAIREIGASFLQQTEPGILLPAQVEFAVSDDGVTFRTAAIITPAFDPKEPGPVVRVVLAEKLGLRGRYVRVRARNVGVLPDWHPARGQKAWLFADEILINGR